MFLGWRYDSGIWQKFLFSSSITFFCSLFQFVTGFLELFFVVFSLLFSSRFGNWRDKIIVCMS